MNTLRSIWLEYESGVVEKYTSLVEPVAINVVPSRSEQDPFGETPLDYDLTLAATGKLARFHGHYVSLLPTRRRRLHLDDLRPGDLVYVVQGIGEVVPRVYVKHDVDWATVALRVRFKGLNDMEFVGSTIVPLSQVYKDHQEALEAIDASFQVKPRRAQ